MAKHHKTSECQKQHLSLENQPSRCRAQANWMFPKCCLEKRISRYISLEIATIPTGHLSRLSWAGYGGWDAELLWWDQSGDARRRALVELLNTQSLRDRLVIEDRATWPSAYGDSKLWHFCSLSTGKRASICTESRVIPVNWIVKKGPIVFSVAIGTPKYLQRPKKLDKSRAQRSSVAAINKKIMENMQNCRRLQLGYGYPFQSSAKRLKNATACWTPHRQSLIIIVTTIPFHSE